MILSLKIKLLSATPATYFDIFVGVFTDIDRFVRDVRDGHQPIILTLLNSVVLIGYLFECVADARHLREGL